MSKITVAQKMVNGYTDGGRPGRVTAWRVVWNGNKLPVHYPKGGDAVDRGGFASKGAARHVARTYSRTVRRRK